MCSIDHEELAAVEAFNEEMAELEDLEHHEELHLLLQDRINGEGHQSRSRWRIDMLFYGLYP